MTTTEVHEMTLREHARALRDRYSDSELHRICIQASNGGFKPLIEAATAALQMIR